MFLFAISFILIWTTTYFITCSLKPKNELGLLYMPIVAFAQIVLTFELLSPFNAIKIPFVLAINIFFLITSIFIWKKQGRPLWKLDCKEFGTRFFNSLKLDKSLIILFIGVVFLIFVVIILNFLLPTTNVDATVYHLSRSLFWVSQGSLKHYLTPEIRSLCLPINSEILYSWAILFTKKDAFIGFFSLTGYFLAMISTYNILSYIKMSTRRKLWIIFIVSSFASVIVQLSSTETDIIIAGLVTSSIFLFWNALKTKEKTPLYISALAYALAVGTKTTSIIMIPAIGIFMLALCAHYKNFKNFLLFLGFGIINFLIFSAYNYVQNFIDFGNIISTESFIVVSKNYYGLKGAVANFIKYIFMFFDFTGLKWNDYFMNDLLHLRTSLLNLLHVNNIPDGIYTVDNGFFQRTLIEPVMGTGVLGFFLLLPCFIISLLRPLLNLKSEKARFLFGFSSIFWVSIITISFLLPYMTYSVRFVMSFIVLGAPVLYYSYLRTKILRPYKYFIILMAMFYLTLVSTHLWARPFFKILNYLSNNNYSITKLRQTASCKDFFTFNYTNPECLVNTKLRTLSKNTRILYLATHVSSTLLIKELELEGYKIDIKLLENPENINFSDYNIIITTNKGQSTSVIRKIENKHEMPCKYEYNPKIPAVYKNKKNFPYKMTCQIPKSFRKKYNLNVIAGYGILTPRIDLKELEYYILFENKNNPAKSK